MNNGGPAFPRPHSAGSVSAQTGMTLRDYFAGQALIGMIASGAEPIGGDTPDNLADLAYTFAEAMLKERDK